MNKAEIMNLYEETVIEKKEFPCFKAGDTITVHYKIKEGNKERIQTFQGVVLQRAGKGQPKPSRSEKFQETLALKGFSRSPPHLLRRLK